MKHCDKLNDWQTVKEKTELDMVTIFCIFNFVCLKLQRDFFFLFSFFFCLSLLKQCQDLKLHTLFSSSVQQPILILSVWTLELFVEILGDGNPCSKCSSEVLEVGEVVSWAYVSISVSDELQTTEPNWSPYSGDGLDSQSREIWVEQLWSPNPESPSTSTVVFVLCGVEDCNLRSLWCRTLQSSFFVV